jgi:hypothetical protein
LYESEIYVSGKYSEINAVYQFMVEARGFPYVNMEGANSCESPFGENIDYSNPLRVVVLDATPVKQDAFNSFSTSFHIRLVTRPVFIGSNLLPIMKCINNNDVRGREWDRSVHVSYDNDNYAVERDNDLITLELSASLNLNDTIALLNFHRVQRGAPFIYRPEDWGVNGVTELFSAIMHSLEVEYVSSRRRNVKITLRRQ